MEYNDLSILIKRKGFTMADLCKTIGISPNGFRKGIETGSLAMKYIKAACSTTGISPNVFMGWTDVEVVPGVYASNISGINSQNSNEAIDALRDQLKEQRGIIKEKDKQINRLLAIIEKGKKN